MRARTCATLTGVALVLLTLLAAGSSLARNSPVYFVADCKRPTMVPTEIVLACGDGNAYVTGLRWKHWGLHRTEGSGTFHGNDCQPTCYQGTFHTYPVELTLREPRYCYAHHKRFYTRLSIHATGAVPPGFHRRLHEHYSPCNAVILPP